ncbi:MAG: alpha/beta fold hydrolase [Kiritimatiellae bacterium]|nr:alpha/beta fold hydrolase [Kiritimatiellia bacterium]
MKEESRMWPGHLVSIPIAKAGKTVWLDGFLRTGAQRAKTLLIFVHGMHSNFYRSHLKKELLSRCVRAGYDLFSFNNRGAEAQVVDERFEDCLGDLDAALAFGRARGYRRFILIGHSTGCQKITWYQARRRDPGVNGLVLLAPGDDYAIAQRDAGRSFNRWVKRAHHLVEEGRGDTLMPPQCLGFSARRYLSVADPARTEAKIFNYEGQLTHFSRVTCPILLLFGSAEEYSCLPVETMHAILRKASRSIRFEDHIIPGADHGFHGCEAETTRRILTWSDSLNRRRGGAKR